MANLIGVTLGQYKVLSELGTGGMATVYRAHQESVGRDVAIKVIQSQLAQNPEFIRRFEREARTIAGLNHPHILKLFDFGQHDDLFYLVTELQPGGSLATLIRNEPLSLGRAGRLFDQIASALDYAHRQGIVHRDLKPQNVLLDSEGNAILTDFGVAKLLSADATALTQSGHAMGTPAYMAPEQWYGQQVDARTDLYALGILAFELLTGKVPFNGDTPPAMMYLHLNEPPPDARALRPDLPKPVQAVLNKALAKQADDRFQSAGALALALRQALAGQAVDGLKTQPVRPAKSGNTPPVVPGAGPTPLESLRDEPERPRRNLTPILALIGAVAVIGIVVMILASRPPVPAEPTKFPESPTAAVQLPTTIAPTNTMVPIATYTATTMPSATASPSPDVRAIALATTNAEQTAVAFQATIDAEKRTIAHETERANQTGTAIRIASYTKTPTMTPSRTATLTSTATSTRTLTATATKTVTRTPVPLTAVAIAPIARNNMWRPIEQEFDGVLMVLVPPGCYMMGSEAGDWDEKPIHRVCFDQPFWIDKFEVTNEQFTEFGGEFARPSHWRDPKRPREQVTWFEAEAFCQRRGTRLPTEAEWEYAARGPNGLTYPWGNIFAPERTVFKGNSSDQTSSVGSKPGASWVNAFDMTGNVWEWVQDWHAPYGDQSSVNPQGPTAGTLRVIRGGSWFSGDPDLLRLTNRDRLQPNTWYDYIGFRCARPYEGAVQPAQVGKPTPTPISPVARNNQWRPIEQEFDSVLMVLVPPGCFMMGSEAGDWDEKPIHRVCFDQPLWIDKFEVTNEQFTKFGGEFARPSHWHDPRRPREQITWFEAEAFCQRRGTRLPTEAEWEYAARGPNGLTYPWGNVFAPERVVLKDNSNNQTAFIGSKPGSSWVNAFDLTGNVWEWVQDWHGPYTDQAVVNPHGPSTGTLRVIRGGSWFSGDPDLLRLTNRDRLQPNTWYDYIGFRCARPY